VISSVVGFAKPDPRIYELALSQTGKAASECVMVGDRLDTDICPAKTAGMKTVRYTNSLFSLQVPRRDCEHADYAATQLLEIPKIIRALISNQDSAQD
jgi:FMN phosphatase YigB (HAD superfamily)